MSKTSYNSLGVITNNSLTVSAYDCRGNILSEADSQNVALHEMGHMLGLGHSNYSGDLMYFSYALSSPVRAVSTLDMYGVGTVFRWMAISPEFDKANQGAAIYSVTLPSSIDYEDLYVSEENIPPPTPLDQIRAYFGYVAADLSDPSFWALMGVFTSIVVAGYLVLKRASRRRMVSGKTGTQIRKA